MHVMRRRPKSRVFGGRYHHFARRAEARPRIGLARGRGLPFALVRAQKQGTRPRTLRARLSVSQERREPRVIKGQTPFQTGIRRHEGKKETKRHRLVAVDSRRHVDSTKILKKALRRASVKTERDRFSLGKVSAPIAVQIPARAIHFGTYKSRVRKRFGKSGRIGPVATADIERELHITCSSRA